MQLVSSQALETILTYVVAKWKCLQWVEESWRPVVRAIDDESEEVAGIALVGAG
jgi:hypothetical protein